MSARGASAGATTRCSSRDYTVERYLAAFEHLCGRLAGHVDRRIFSFVEMYKKLEVNMPELILLTDVNMDQLAEGLLRMPEDFSPSVQGACGKAPCTRKKWTIFSCRAYYSCGFSFIAVKITHLVK